MPNKSTVSSNGNTRVLNIGRNLSRNWFPAIGSLGYGTGSRFQKLSPNGKKSELKGLSLNSAATGGATCGNGRAQHAKCSPHYYTVNVVGCPIKNNGYSSNVTSVSTFKMLF